MTGVLATDDRGKVIEVTPAGFPGGTPLFSAPTVALVLRSEEGDYLAHIELIPTQAQILGEEIRKAAEAAQTTLEE